MRVELRVEEDEHEYSVIIESDRSVDRARLLSIAQQAMTQLTETR
jgi:hypothetical protein